MDTETILKIVASFVVLSFFYLMLHLLQLAWKRTEREATEGDHIHPRPAPRQVWPICPMCGQPRSQEDVREEVLSYDFGGEEGEKK